MNKKNQMPFGIGRGIKQTEIDIWLASPKQSNEKNFDEWLKGEKDWVANFNIPIRNLFIFEKSGKFPGKLCFIEENKDYILFAMPAIKKCPDSKYIAIELFKLAIKEAKKRNVTRLETFLDDCNTPYQTLKQALLKTGFKINKRKVIYEKTIKRIIKRPTGKVITYKTLRQIGLAAIQEVFAGSLEDSLERKNTYTRLSPEKEFMLHWNYMRHKEFTCVAYYNNQPIGLILPDLLDDKTGTFIYMGILPCFRSLGFGGLLFVDGLNMLISKGANHYIDSTSSLNYPMIKIFNKNKCTEVMSRSEFIYSVVKPG